MDNELKAIRDEIASLRRQIETSIRLAENLQREIAETRNRLAESVDKVLANLLDEK